MKKISTWLLPLLLITVMLAVSSCQKGRDEISVSNPAQVSTTEFQGLLKNGPVNRAYRDSFDVDLQFIPDIAAGWKYPQNAPAWFHGSGTGHATHMGNVTTYFNTYTVRNAAGGVTVYGRPVNQFYATELQSLNVPPDVHSVILDDKGNSAWGKFAPEGLTSWHVDAAHIAMVGKNFIVGGTGKFAGVTGETTLHAVFNQFDLKEASVWQEGRITY